MTVRPGRAGLLGWVRESLSPAVYVLDDRRQQICVENSWVLEHAGEEDEDEHAAEHWDDDLATPPEGDKPNPDGGQGAPDATPSSNVGSGPPASSASQSRGRTGRKISNAIGVIVSLLIVLAVVVTVCGTAWNVMQAVAGWLRLPSIAGPFLAIGSLFIIVPIHRVTIGKFERSKRALLEVASSVKLGRCGGCRYNLKDIHAEPDGCTCCPECGGAWRLDAWKHDFPELNIPGLPDGTLRQHTGWTTVEDARRTRVPLMARRQQADVAVAVKDRSRKERFPPRGRRRPFFAFCSLCVIPLGASIAMMFGLAWIVAQGSSRPRQILAVLGFLAVVSGVFFFLRALYRAAARQEAAKLIARDLLRAGTCPCCEGPLPPGTSIGDGAQVCRTCGTAWKPET